MKDLDAIFKVIDEKNEMYIDFLEKICTYEARAYDKKTMDQLADFIQKFAISEGMSVERVPFDTCGDFLVIDINPEAEKSVLMLAHMDTVHDKGIFGNPPVKREGNIMTGPGIIDCKGGIAIALLVMKALAENGYDKNIRLLLTSDEEVSNVLGGEKELRFFREQVQGYDYAINCEVAETNELTISRKGILRYKVEVQGKGGHSGMNYFECKNPIIEAAHKMIALAGRSEFGKTSYSCNVIQGGSVDNVIPDVCEFSIDIRICALKDMDVAKKTVEEIVSKSFLGGTTAKAELVSVRLPMEKNDDTMKLFDDLQKISCKYGLGELTAIESGGGSDSAYTQNAGVVSICGAGACGKGYHTDWEYVELDSIARRAKLIAAFTSEYKA